MAFDKIKAMRNAEKFLAQGKIKAAIGEYNQVVENDPNDFGTMNLLGDLYTKTDENGTALRYYTKVAEHYSKQGFNQKAIAVYNKINRIQPNSTQVSEKLAELYRTKGSVTEAKSHYVVLAENYEAKGRIVEALAMWKQIALLDPTNIEVYPNVAAMCLRAGQIADGVDALADAGERFLNRGMVTEAEGAYLSGLGHIPTHARCLAGFMNTQSGKGDLSAAVEKLESILAENQNDREVLNILADCYLEAGDNEKAEKAVIKLVEQEPASYPRFLEFANRFISQDELARSCRMLTMASEHLLAAGEAEGFISAVQQILHVEPDNLDAVRLLVRFCTWQKDEEALKDSLRRLADLSRAQESIDDERVALSQLVVLMPQEAAFTLRLKELKDEHGFDEMPVTQSLFDERFVKRNGNRPDASEITNGPDFAIVEGVVEASNGHDIVTELDGVTIQEDSNEPEFAQLQPSLDQSPEARLAREVESIRFYIDSGYTELAEKAIEEFESEFGKVPQAADLRSLLCGGETSEDEAISEDSNPSRDANKLFDIGDFRTELGLEDPDAPAESDFETKYNTAIAYKEMGLLEQAIAEFQDAVAIPKPNDGTRRFFNCANLLGHSFMENGMPKLAATWYQRALEISDLSTEEKQALWYELGLVHETEGEYPEAAQYFEKVYAENVDFRDVRERLKNISIAA